MSSDRAGGPSPVEPGGNRHAMQNTKAEREAKQRVEKVREVDPDEQAKRRRKDQFDSYLNAPEPEAAPKRTPTPFDSSFHNESPTEPSVQKMKSRAVPTPGQTPPPTVAGTGEENEGKVEVEGGLPQSKVFWQETDLPPDQPLTKPRYKEQVPGEKAKKETKPVVLPEVPEMKIERRGVAIKKAEEQHAPAPRKPHKEPRETRPTKAKKEEAQPFAPIQPQGEQQQGQGDKKQQNKQKPIAIDTSLLPHAPREIHQVAQATTQQVASSLNPESAALFYQMVGTIYLNLPPGSGISQTVIVLNQSAFANSKFFGATITIEKYATAPDALNIRLSGTNQAVNAFQENIASLMSAFENARLPFKINRIDVEYTPQRPLFRRKDPKKGNDLSGGMGESKR